MIHSYKYYLKCDPSELKNMDAKYDLIASDDKYEFIWFCQNASQEQIETLLDETGIIMLVNMPDAIDRINGGAINGAVDSNLLKNKFLCECIHENGMNFANLLNQTSEDYFTFLLKEHPMAILGVFAQLNDEVQQHILKSQEFSSKQINSMLYRCKKNSCQQLLDSDDRLTLDKANYERLMALGELDVTIPDRLFNNSLVLNVSTMDDVNEYRSLITSLSYNNDTSKIESERKKFYEQELNSIEQDGLLPEYRDLLECLKKGQDISCALDCLGRFGFNADIFEALENSENIEETIRHLSDYKVSNMIMDYFFESIPTNVLTDMNEMLDFQPQVNSLTAEQFAIFANFAEIDQLDVQGKIQLFRSFKDQDLMGLFYDCYSKTKDMMVDSINETILNPDNIEQHLDFQKSTEAGVPVYYMHGQKFKALIRGWGKPKDMPLEGGDFIYTLDGYSFSIDGSDLLTPFKDPREFYTIAYTGIPAKQLIHLFPTDSYTSYKRGIGSGIPDRHTQATTKILKFMVGDELTENTAHYNEALVAVPSSKRKDSELDEKMTKPKPMAIYCYDNITPRDIEAAKKFGLGIILVDTKEYNNEAHQGLTAADTILNPDEYDYVQPGKDDPRLNKHLKDQGDMDR